MAAVVSLHRDLMIRAVRFPAPLDFAVLKALAVLLRVGHAAGHSASLSVLPRAA
jgi:hypothetical protein